MITLHLTGYLAKLVPNPDIKVQANSVVEAVSFLQQYDAFNPRKVNRKYTVEIPGFQTRDALFDSTDVTDIFIVPIVAGSKQGGWLQIIVGIILIVVAVFCPYLSPAMASAFMMNGAMMILGGVLQLLSPQPKLAGMGGIGSEERSKYLGANGNTVAIGTQIPIIYGRRKWGGHYVSFNVDAGEMNKAPESWYSSTFTDYGELTHSAAPETMPDPEPWEMSQVPQTNYAEFLTENGQVKLHFSPAINLDSGQYDVMFDNGVAISVQNPAAGLVSSVISTNGIPSNLPAVGTPILVTRNYV